jgi:acyl-CoA thioesterase-1
MTKSSIFFCLLLSCLQVLAKPAAEATPPVVLVLGDSLSAAYGIDPQDGWVALLETELQRQGHPHRVVNASISGETTSGGRRRLPELLTAHHPSLVIIELGANDGLRGIALDEVRANLQAMLDATVASGASPALVRMEVPPNYGPEYTQGFKAIYDSLKDSHPTLVVLPFFLADVILEPGLMQADGLHPTAEAQPRLLATVWPRLAGYFDSPAVEQP